VRTALLLFGLFAIGALLGWVFWPAAPPAFSPPPPVPVPAAAPPPAPGPVETPKPPPAAPAPPAVSRPPENIEAFSRAMADLQLALADEAWEPAFAAFERAVSARPEDPAVADARRRMAEAASARLRRLHREAGAPVSGPLLPDDPVFASFETLAAYVSRLPQRDPAFGPLVPPDLPPLKREMEFLRTRAEAEAFDRGGEWAAAEAAYAKAETIAGKPDDLLARGRRFVALCAKGRAHRDAGRVDEAAAAYRKALESGVRHPRAEWELSELAAWQAETGRRERERVAASARSSVAAAERAVESGAWAEAVRLLDPLASAGALLSEDQRALVARLLRVARLGAATPAGMAYGPAGPFVMGCDGGEPRERPAHRVDVGDFYIDLRETTNREYRAFLDVMREKKDHRGCPPGEPDDKDHTPAFWDDPSWNGDDAPVIGVDWFDAASYAAWAGKRLPSEAEWEKAAGWDAVAGKQRTYPWGETFDRGLFHSDEGRAARVGAYPAGRSPCGCLDMAGGVFEWITDWAKAYGGGSLGDPFTGEGYRVIRGGIWPPDEPRVYARTAYRQFALPDRRETTVGFRCVKVP
jgi:formylglycine-generating enzyme required for sulfatase activity